MRKYQYDDVYFIAKQANIFPLYADYEQEEAFSRIVNYGKYGFHY